MTLTPPKAKKKKEPVGVLALIGKPIQFVDCRNNKAGHGILRSIQDGWVGIETDDEIIYFNAFKLDAFKEIKVN